MLQLIIKDNLKRIISKIDYITIDFTEKQIRTFGKEYSHLDSRYTFDFWNIIFFNSCSTK